MRAIEVWRNLEVEFLVFMVLENGKVEVLFMLKRRNQRQ